MPDSKPYDRKQSMLNARSHVNRDRPFRNKTNQLRRLYEMQDVMFEGVKNAPEWSDRVSASRAWRELELLRRLILGKPSTVAAEQPVKKSASISSVMPVDERVAA